METLNSRLYKPCLILFSFFFLALLTSMAAMEIFGWSLFLLVVAAYFRGDLRLKVFFLHPLVHITLLFCIWIALSLLWNRHQVPQLGASLAELRWFFTLMGLAGAWSLLLRRPLSQLLVFLVLICVGLVSVYAIYQHFEGVDLFRKGRILPWAVKTETFVRYRPTGLFSLTLTFSAIYAMATCICLAFTLWFWNQRRRTLAILSAAVFLLSLNAVILSYSRGIWFALALALLFMAFLYHRRLGLLLMTTLTLIGALAIFSSENIRDRVISITDTENRSNYARVYLWQINWVMFKENPLFGVGFENNGPPLVRTYGERLGHTEDIDSHAHNNYLNTLSGTGLPGLCLYLLMMAASFYYTLREYLRRKESHQLLSFFLLASLGAQLVFHLGGLTEYNFGDAEVQYQLLAWIALGIAVSSNSKLQDDSQ